MDHSNQTTDSGIHGVVAIPYANAAARLAVANYPTSFIYKVAIDLDTRMQWLLVNTAPATWIPLGSIASAVKDTVLAISLDEIASLSGLDKVADGVDLDTDGYRVLLVGQSTDTQNGPWVVHAGSWTRASDLSAGTHASGTIFPVLSGVRNRGTLWMCSAPYAADVVGTDALPFINVGGASAYTSVVVDIDLTTSGNVVIDTRPAAPTGSNRWKLVSIDLRVKEALDGGTAPTASVKIGSTSGGNQIVLEQTLDGTSVVGAIVGGFALSSLGSDMSQSTGFEAMYPVDQAIYAGVSNTGTPTSGIVTAYLIWQGLP